MPGLNDRPGTVPFALLSMQRRITTQKIKHAPLHPDAR